MSNPLLSVVKVLERVVTQIRPRTPSLPYPLPGLEPEATATRYCDLLPPRTDTQEWIPVDQDNQHSEW